MGFLKVHGFKLAANSYAQNMVVETFTNATEPTAPANAGRIWFNSDLKSFRITELNGVGAVIIRTLTSEEELALQTADASGSKLVGYDGKTGTNGKFSLTADSLDDTLDAIVTELDDFRNDFDALGTGSLTDMQNEINDLETAIGGMVDSNGDYVAFTTSNYMDAATSVTGAVTALDGAINTLQGELDDTQAGIGGMLDANGDFLTTAVSASNFMTTVTTISEAINALDSQLDTTNDTANAALPKAGGTMTGSITMSNSGTITGLPTTPTSSSEAASKAYVDALASGLDPKTAVKASSTVAGGNVDLSSFAPDGVLDGITILEGDRFLLKNQTDAKQNGIYVMGAALATRSGDADGTPVGEVVKGMYVYVSSGTTQEATGWVLTSGNPVAIGTTELNFSQFSAAGLIVAGTGLKKAGNVLSVGLGAGVNS